MSKLSQNNNETYFIVGFPHAVQVYGAGTHNLINFIAMQLVGHNLAKLRRLMKEPQKFTLSTTMRLAIQCFEAIRDLHSLGAIHRDVKPVKNLSFFKLW